MRRLAIFGLLLAASAACSKGSGGKDGAPGGAGLQGGWALAPRITTIDPPVASYDSVLLVQGLDFAVTTTANEVWIGGTKAEVLAATSTTLTITHIGEPGLDADEIDDVTIVSHDLISNPIELHVYPQGAFVSVPMHAPSGIGSMVPLGDGSLALFRPASKEILDVTPDGDISLYSNGIAGGAFNPISRPDGIYYLTDSAVRRWFDGNDYQIFGAGDPRAMAIDATGNIFVAIQSSTDTMIMRRDYATGVVDPFWTTVTGVVVTSMVAQNGKLYVWGSASGPAPIHEITATTDVALTTNVDAHTMVGDGTLLYIADTGVVKTVDAAGTIATYSTKKLSTGVVDEIARNDSGEVFYRVGDQIWFVDATTFRSHVASLSPTRSIGILGNLFAGSADTCGIGDSKGGVFYELHFDGTMRRVVNDYCGFGTPGFFAGAFYSAVMDGSIAQVSPAGFQTPAIPSGNIVSPLFVVADGQGNLYIPNSDGATGWRVSKYTADGALLDADFVPSFADQPVAGAIFGTDLALGFAATREIRTTPLASGAVLTHFATPGFQPVISGISAGTNGSLLVRDGSDQSLWSVAPDGTATSLGPSGLDPLWYLGSDGSYVSVGTDSIDLVLP